MLTVKLLSSDVIAKIAAGEVVERPSSVLKELIENSLDAGATFIEIVLMDGGKTLIHIRDNGKGISQDDMQVLFHRHATSKIVSAEDLEQVLSFGFRGEALYSVAAVSEVVCQSRLMGQSESWQITVRGGIKEPIMPTSLSEQGTDIKVENLFFNTPARRKFLKSHSAEAESCVNVILSAALARPDVHFICHHQGKLVLDLPIVPTITQRLAKAHKLPLAHLHQSSGQNEEHQFKWTLVVGDMNIMRQRRDLQYVFINGRVVQHKMISFFMNEAFSLIFPKGSCGCFLVFVDLPPENVDVNVHPTKKEVRLHHDNSIGLILKNACESLLMTQTPTKSMAFGDSIFSFPPSNSLPVSAPLKKSFMDSSLGLNETKDLYQKTKAPQQKPESVAKSPSVEPPQSDQAAPPSVQESLVERLSQARFIGTFDYKYHLLEDKGSLFVVDQHAAQERILFERFLAQVKARQVETQILMIPILVTLNPKEMIVFEELKSSLINMGFDITLFNEHTLAIQAHPMAIKNPTEVVLALCARESVVSFDEDVLARRACRASVMAGDKMFVCEVERQIQDLLQCQDPYTCPHGRPIVIELKGSFLDRQFLRIV